MESQTDTHYPTMRPLVPFRCLLVGRSGAGKSTIIDWLRMFISNRGHLDQSCLDLILSPRDRTIDPPEVLQHEMLLDAALVKSIERTLNIKDSITEELSPEGVLFHLWDFGGQLRLLEQARKRTPRHIFRAADLLIWVVDSRHPSNLKESYKEFVAFRETCPDARAVVFLNKWDFVNYSEDGIVLHMDERVSVRDVVDIFGIDQSNVFTTSVPRWKTLMSSLYEIVVRSRRPVLECDMQYRPLPSDDVETETITPPLIWPVDRNRLEVALHQVLSHTGMVTGGIIDLDERMVAIGLDDWKVDSAIDHLCIIPRGTREIDKILTHTSLNTETKSFPVMTLSGGQSDSLIIHVSERSPQVMTIAHKPSSSPRRPSRYISDQFDSFGDSVGLVIGGVRE